MLGEVGNDLRAPLFQVGDVAVAVKGDSRLPDAKQYSDPAPSYLSYRSVMLHPTVAEQTITGFAPRAKASCTFDKFVEGLTKIFGTSVSPIDAT